MKLPQTDPAPYDDGMNAYRQTMKGLGKLVDGTTPWLLELGVWVFGGLIAVDLLVVSALLSRGPVDVATRVSTAALALALPLALAGLSLLKLVQNMKRDRFDEEWMAAFKDSGLTDEEQGITLKDLESLPKQRARAVLIHSLWILALTSLLTLIGMAAALWYMAWWIGVAFLAMIVLSPVIVVSAMSTPARIDSKEDKERESGVGGIAARAREAEPKENRPPSVTSPSRRRRPPQPRV